MADISSITLPGGGTYDLKDKNAVHTSDVDPTPTANSTNPVQSGGVYTDVRTRVPVYGLGKNLIRNWYFADPVNQRGNSSYAGANAYSISGWKTNPSAGSKVEVSTGAVTVSKTGTGTGGMLQIVSKEPLLGKTVTLSVLYKHKSGGAYNLGLRQGAAGSIGSLVGNAISLSGAVGTLNLSSVTVAIPSTISNNLFVAFYAPAAAGSVDVMAVKLELGTEQTLCHNEGTYANPVWVLNEIPDYEYELYRCMTSTADPSDTFANKVLSTNIPNKNLLDNAYFVGGGSQLGDGIFPINQRGQTSYTLSSGVYTVDRWRAYKYSGSATVNLTGDGLEFSGQDCAFAQKVKVNSAELLGKTVTLSALVNGNLLSATAVMPTSFNQSSNVINIQRTGFSVALASRPAPIGWTNAYFVALGTTSTTAKVIKAVKLEFGTEQTLAHQENGVWVLNEIPDYETEWNKCNKYLRVYYRDSTYAKSKFINPRFSHESRAGYAQFAFQIDPPMASAPTVTNNDALAIRTIASSANVANVTFSFPNATINTLNIRADSSNITAGTLYWVATLNAGNKIILSAEP